MISLKPDPSFLTDQEIMDELSKRFTGFIFVGEEKTKTTRDNAYAYNPMWYKGSWAGILGYLHYGELRVMNSINSLDRTLDEP